MALFANTFNSSAKQGAPTGAIVPTFGAANVGTQWLLLNGQTVSKRDYRNLYAILQGHVTETATTFDLPNLTNRTVMGAGATALMALAGSNSVTLSVTQLPSHNHTLTDPGHTHAFTGTPHTHTITDPGHTHTGSAQGTLDALTLGAGSTTAAAGNTGSSTTGITINAATAGGTNASATTGITLAPAGGGAPVDITPAIIGVNWLVKT